MVGRHQDGRPVAETQAVERLEHPSDVVVGIAHAGVVSVVDPAHVVHVGHLGRLPGPPVPHVARTEPRHLLGGVRPGEQPVGGTDLLGQPRRQRVAGERLAERPRGPVRRVGIPQMHVQEPVGAPRVAGQPRLGRLGDLVGRLHPLPPQVHALVEPGIEVVRRMALGERADRRRPPPEVPERRHPTIGGGPGPEAASASLGVRVGGHPAVVDDPGEDPEAAARECRTGRQARRVRGVHVVEADAPGSQGVDHRAGGTPVAIATEMIGPQGVDVEVDQPHARPRVSWQHPSVQPVAVDGADAGTHRPTGTFPTAASSTEYHLP